MKRFTHAQTQRSLTLVLDSYRFFLLLFSDKTANIIYQIAHEYQIPTVLKSAETILVSHTSSFRFDYIYNSNCYQSEYLRNHCREFLSKAFEMLIFAETYNNTSLLSTAAERISVLPMCQFTEYSSYKDLAESVKNKILMYRLRRCDTSEALNDKVISVFWKWMLCLKCFCWW